MPYFPSPTKAKFYLVPLEKHLLVAADLDSGTCVGKVTIVTEDELTKKLVETMLFTKEEFKEP